MASQNKAMSRLFMRSRTRACDLPGVRELFTQHAAACTEALRQGAVLDVTVELESIDQVPVAKLSQRQQGCIDVSVVVPQWPTNALVRLESDFLFRALDAMFGGDPAVRREALSRSLTSLESALAISLARIYSSWILPVLGASSPNSLRIVDEAEPPLAAGTKSECVVAVLRVSEFGDRVVLALPEPAFDRLRDQRASEEKKEAPVFDPAWTQEFARNVSSATITLQAAIEGPRLPLSAIAGLREGALIELDLEAIRRVVVTSRDQPVFTGRLGQSRGMFTVMLERPAKVSEE